MNPTYPQYTPPSVDGIQFAAGAGFSFQPLPPGSLCLMADAIIVHKSLGGTLVNAADYPDLNYAFKGLDPSNAAQPWMIIGIGADGFVGPDVTAMYAKGIGHPGAWQKDAMSGQWSFVFAPDPPPIPAPPVTPNPADAASWASVQGVPGTPGNPAAGGSGGGLSAAQAAQMNHIESMLVTLLTAERLPTT